MGRERKIEKPNGVDDGSDTPPRHTIFTLSSFAIAEGVREKNKNDYEPRSKGHFFYYANNTRQRKAELWQPW